MNLFFRLTWRGATAPGRAGPVPPYILYLVPDCVGRPGGIALHVRSVVRAVRESRARLTVIALHDANRSVPDITGLYFPCRGSRAMFLRRAAAAACSRPRLILLEHANFSLAGWVLARASGARLVIFLHGVEAWEKLPTLRRFALRRADGWIAVSAYTADRAAAANELPRDRIAVLHHCLSGTTRVAGPPDDSAPSILTVGRIVATEGYKGHDRVIRAMPALLDRFPDLVYHIAGDGDMRPFLEDLARREGIAAAVRFHGIVSNEDLNRLYHESSVFVMPSTGEGFGFVFLEAMAHGLPVVAGNADATPEVVVDGQTGFLVDPYSENEITDALAALLSDPALWARMGQAGRERVAREFSYEAFSSGLLAILGFSRTDGETGE